MRQTNINCPQCNGLLGQQEDKFYCSSCGSAFNIAYDKADVEYARLVTQPERTRLLLEKDRILLEKNEELRKKFLTSEMKAVFVDSVKRQGTTYIGGIIMYAAIGGMVALLSFGLVFVIFVNSWKSAKEERNERDALAQRKTARLENLSAEDIENDLNFLENAIAGGVRYEVSRRDKPVTNRSGDEGDAYTVGSPEAVDCYLVKTGTKNDLYIVYRNTYEYSVSGTTRDVYDCVRYENIEPDGTGHILFGPYACNQISGDGINWHWIGYESSEDVYDDVLPKSSAVYPVDF